MSAPRVVSVEFKPDPVFGMIPGMGGEPKHVVVTLDNGDVIDVFSYYTDELRFTEQEFKGLTIDEVRALHYQKDMQWLRS